MYNSEHPPHTKESGVSPCARHSVAAVILCFFTCIFIVRDGWIKCKENLLVALIAPGAIAPGGLFMKFYIAKSAIALYPVRL